MSHDERHVQGARRSEHHFKLINELGQAGGELLLQIARLEAQWARVHRIMPCGHPMRYDEDMGEGGGGAGCRLCKILDLEYEIATLAMEIEKQRRYYEKLCSSIV
jgi:hypothetical protein